MPITDVKQLRWTRAEYEGLAEGGFFAPEARLELIDGLIYHLAPQTSFHSTAVRATQEALRQVFREGFDIRVQLPLTLGDDSEPEPDVAVVPGHFADYCFGHPTTATLLVEVADSSLLHDRRRKIPRYARAGLPEAWLLVVQRKVLEVYREPVDRGYQSRTILRAWDTVSPLAAPEAQLPVAAFFPWESRSSRR